MAKKPPTTAKTPTRKLTEALLQAPLTENGFVADDPIDRPGGIYEANVAVDLRDTEGREFRVFVSRQR